MSLPWKEISELSLLGLSFLWGGLAFMSVLAEDCGEAAEHDDASRTEPFGARTSFGRDHKRVSPDQIRRLLGRAHSVLHTLAKTSRDLIPQVLDCLMKDAKRSFWKRQIYAPSEMLALMSDLLTSAAWVAGVFESDRRECEECLGRVRSRYAVLVAKAREPYCLEPLTVRWLKTFIVEDNLGSFVLFP